MAAPSRASPARFGAITVWASGRLGDALLDRLARVGPSSDARAAMTCAVAAVAADTDEEVATQEQRVRDSGLPWLTIQGELDRVLIGPITRPGSPGCRTCLARRRTIARAADVQGERELRKRRGSQMARVRSPLLGALGAGAAAAVAVQELLSWVTEGASRCTGGALMLDLATLSVNRHPVLADPLCGVCGKLPDDGPEAARWRRRPLPKLSSHSFRTRELTALESRLLDTYSDAETGLITEIRPSGDFALPMVSARLHPTDCSSHEEGYGRTADFRSARLTAVVEALERLGGFRPGGRRTSVRGSYRALQPKALDPATLGLYQDEAYRVEGFPYQRYHPDLELNWVWGYSFGRKAPALVPERYAYYALPRSEHRFSGYALDPPLVYEISNGCAIGSSVEEATLHGLLEIAERDAFLMTWFARMRIPAIDPASAADRRIPWLVERVRARSGYQVHIFANSLEQQIPSFWVMAVDQVPSPERPRVLCVAGSALQPERGALNGLQELTTLLDAQLASYPANRARARNLVENPDLVTRMDDHALLYGHPDAFSRFDFLLADRTRRSFAEQFGDRCWPEHHDLQLDLDELVGRYRAVGLDVLVVDQTSTEHRELGFACVKVIVPGTLPMTFGHRARRLHGLPRLYRVPFLLGYRERVLAATDINPYPHPFP